MVQSASVDKWSPSAIKVSFTLLCRLLTLVDVAARGTPGAHFIQERLPSNPPAPKPDSCQITCCYADNKAVLREQRKDNGLKLGGRKSIAVGRRWWPLGEVKSRW